MVCRRLLWYDQGSYGVIKVASVVKVAMVLLRWLCIKGGYRVVKMVMM